jgi:SulP family sulfate permease
MPSDLSYRIVVYDFAHVGYLDTSAALAIDEIIELAQRSGQGVLVSGLKGHAATTLEGLGVLNRVPRERRFDERLDAIRSAVGLVTDDGRPV